MAMERSATVPANRPTDAEIYEKHAPELIRFAMGLVGRNDASDVVSEAILGAISANSWSEVSNRRAYLYRAVLNQAKNHHRDRQRRWAKELRSIGATTIAPPEYRPEVLAAVKKLSLRQRAVIVLAYWDDLAPDQIGSRLGISEGCCTTPPCPRSIETAKDA